MPGLAMKCPACSYTWLDDRFIHVRNATNVTVVGNQMSCPRCGSMARQAEEGTFNVDKDGRWTKLRDALTPEGATRDDYQALLQAFRDAKSQDSDVDDLASKIAASNPKFKALSDWMLSHKGEAFAVWLTLIIAILTYLKPESAPEPTQVKVDVHVNQTYEGPTDQQIRQYVYDAVCAAEAGRDIGTVPMPGQTHTRTRPCWCGSGKQYKRCHGAA